MTDELLQVARDSLPEFEAALGYRPNLSFVKGYIEDLSAIASQSVDIIISNCVINLSPRCGPPKPPVKSSAYLFFAARIWC